MEPTQHYNELLISPEWEARRSEILKKDEFKCRRCKKKQYDKGIYTRLNVHHLRYVIGKLPWQYPDEELITLCESCHKTEHQILFYNKNEIIQLNWKRINSHLYDNDIVSKSYEIKVEGKIINGCSEFLMNSYSNYYYRIRMRDHQYAFNNPANVKVEWIGTNFNCFHKETPFTFFTIYDSILKNQYQIDKQYNSEISIKIGANQKPFTYTPIQGLWLNIKVGFYYSLTDSNKNILISTKRILNDYVDEPAKKDYIEFFIEENHLKDLDYIVEQRILQKIPFFIEQSI